jgi:excisionase family DNA binding protein
MVSLMAVQKKSAVIVLESPRLYLNIEDAAQYLRVSRRTMHTLIKTRQVTFTRVRDGLRFRLQWLNEYLDKRTVKAA